MFRLFSRYWQAPVAISLLAEGAILVAAVWGAHRLRFGVYESSSVLTADLPAKAAIFSLLILGSLYFNGLYDFKARIPWPELGARLARSLAVSAMALWGVYYLFPAAFTGRGVFAISLALGTALLMGWRLLLHWGLQRSFLGERLLIVGSGEGAQQLAQAVWDYRNLGYRVVGYVDDQASLQAARLVGARVIGTSGQVCELAHSNGITRVIVAQEDSRGTLNMDQLLACKTSGISVERGSSFLERLTGRIAVEGLRKSWLIFGKGFVISDRMGMVKRLMDFAAALVGMVLALPVMILVATAVFVDSRGSLLYCQQRVGKNGRVFWLWKFRTMRVDAEAAGGAKWAAKNDDRVTRVGKFLRKYRLDELPQLWNIVRGDMSLVGPRPERPEFVQQLVRIDQLYSQRHVVRPGLTGWAQINAQYASSFEESIEKLEYDLFYVNNLSLALDLSIFASTARIVLLGQGGR